LASDKNFETSLARIFTSSKACKCITNSRTKQSNSERGNSIGRYIIERNKEFLTPIFERIAWEQVRQYYNNKTSNIYSHHETVDALAITGYLSKYANGVILLMQSNIKGLIAEGILSNIKSKLLGVLAVSPQPIVESPFIANMTKNLKVLIPAVALDPLVYAVVKPKSQVEQYSAVYFGRLSREKGLVDLLRAWSIISQRKPRARLTLIGMPENHEILATINKYIAKYRNVRYLGYLPPEKLYREVARHHVLIYPLYRDAFSLTVLEALALGLGIVAYDIPAIRFMYSRNSMVYVVK
jgi:glycosyltransferase involved in cell wall biosynthesis